MAISYCPVCGDAVNDWAICLPKEREREKKSFCDNFWKCWSALVLDSSYHQVISVAVANFVVKWSKLFCFFFFFFATLEDVHFICSAAALMKQAW